VYDCQSNGESDGEPISSDGDTCGVHRQESRKHVRAHCEGKRITKSCRHGQASSCGSCVLHRHTDAANYGGNSSNGESVALATVCEGYDAVGVGWGVEQVHGWGVADIVHIHATPTPLTHIVQFCCPSHVVRHASSVGNVPRKGTCMVVAA
jgi:hypothetical protein